MHRDLLAFRIGVHHWTIHSYGVLLLLGMAAGITVAARRAPRYGLERFDVVAAGLLACCGGIFGAWLLFVLLHLRDLAAAPLELLARPGMVFYGGLGGACASAAIYLRGYGLPVAAALDAAAPAIPLGHALGRVGCFLAGCCYGRPTGSALGVWFTDPRTAAGRVSLDAGMPLHPLQLYEAAGLLGLVAALLVVEARRREPRLAGRLFLGYLGGYALLRLYTETLRGDAIERGFLVAGVLSASQGLALAALALVAAIHLRGRRPTA